MAARCAPGPGALLVALLCAEESVAVVGFLLAHLLVLEDLPMRRRVRVVVPYAATIAGWYLFRRALGYGTVGPGSYTDAFAEPLTFCAQTLARLPIYVHSQLGALPADLWEVYFVRRGLGWVMVLAGVAFMILMAAGLGRLVRRDRLARFWAIGGAIALVPICGAHPNDRHLFIVGLGGAALVARYLAAWADRGQPEQARLLPQRGATVLAGFFVLVHLVLAPIALPIRARIPAICIEVSTASTIAFRTTTGCWLRIWSWSTFRSSTCATSPASFDVRTAAPRPRTGVVWASPPMTWWHGERTPERWSWSLQADTFEASKTPT